MTVNIDNALRLAAACITGSEGFAATAYLDRIAKPPVWTIGHGTTWINDAPVQAGMVCTKAEADRWAAEDMEVTMHYIIARCSVPMNDFQASACCSLAYNIGLVKYRESTVLAALNAGDYYRAANCFLEYDHAGGKKIPGLTARRERERAMFLLTMPQPISTMSDADKLNQKQLDEDKPA